MRIPPPFQMLLAAAQGIQCHYHPEEHKGEKRLF